MIAARAAKRWDTEVCVTHHERALNVTLAGDNDAQPRANVRKETTAALHRGRRSRDAMEGAREMLGTRSKHDRRTVRVALPLGCPFVFQVFTGRLPPSPSCPQACIRVLGGTHTALHRRH